MVAERRARTAMAARSLRLWAFMWWTALRGQSQFRLNFVFGICGGIAVQTTALAFLATVLTRFGDLGGWRLPDIAFAYGLRLLSHALWVIPFAPLFTIYEAVRDGEFDRYLTRPVSALAQVTTRTSHPVTYGHLIAGIALFGGALHWAPIDWTVWKVGFLAGALLGGALVELSLQLLVASLAFRWQNLSDVMLATDQIYNTVGNYPVHIFTPVLRWGLTAIIPLAFAVYFPACVLLGRWSDLWVPVWVAYASPLLGVVLITVAWRVWRVQLNHYTSAGG